MTSIVNVQQTKGKAISRGKAPRVAAMLKTNLDFNVDLNLSVTYDMADDINNKWGISGIQSVYVDNDLNSDVLIIRFDNGYKISCPAYSQAIFPVFFSGEVLSFVATSSVPITCSLHWLNTREQAQVWSAKIPIGGTVNVTGSTVLTQKPNDTWDNGSVAIITGGTAQSVLPANSGRKTLSIRNPATPGSQGIAVPEPLYIWFGAGGAGKVPGDLGTWELLPGEQTPAWDLVTTEQIWIIAATTGHRATILSMS